MSEYDLRQLRLMRDALQRYDRSNTVLEKLSHLLAHLEALVHVLELVDEHWKFRFLGKLGVLDEVYAVAVDKGRTTLTADDVQLVSRALEEIEKLVSERLPPGNDDQLDH